MEEHSTRPLSPPIVGVWQSKIASYRARSKVMGERIFRTGQQEATSPSDDLGSPTVYGDNIAENASKTPTNSSQDVKVEVSQDGAYVVARAGPAETSRVDCGAGSEEDEGRRRHDLLLVSGTRRAAHITSLIPKFSCSRERLVVGPPPPLVHPRVRTFDGL